MPKISHPYPPSYRSNPSPDQASSSDHHLHMPSNQGQGQGQGWEYGYDTRSMAPSPQPLLPPISGSGSNRSRSPDDPTVPLTAGLGGGGGRGLEAGNKEIPTLATGPGIGGPAGLGHDGELRSKDGCRVDAQGIVLPENWTKEDEEAEKEFLRKGLFDWKALMGWRYWIRKEWWGESWSICAPVTRCGKVRYRS